MADAKEFKVTEPRKVLLRELTGGVKKWGELRLAYFGPERGKSKSNTAFHVQLTGMIKQGIIQKDPAGYALSDTGNALVAKLKEDGVSLEGAQSKAQQAFVAPEEAIDVSGDDDTPPAA